MIGNQSIDEIKNKFMWELILPEDPLNAKIYHKAKVGN